MSYYIIISEYLDKLFYKISKKDSLQFLILKKKIKNISENPYQFKPLMGNMKGLRRVHIGKSFVLTYVIIESEKVVKLVDYDHHDRIYKK